MITPLLQASNRFVGVYTLDSFLAFLFKKIPAMSIAGIFEKRNLKNRFIF